MIGSTITERERRRESEGVAWSLRLSVPLSPRYFVWRLPRLLVSTALRRYERFAPLGRPLAAVFDQAIVSGTSFLAAVLVGRSAGEEQLGLYSLGITLVVLACGVQESLVLIPYTVLAARTADDRRAQFAASALLQSVLAGVVMMALVALGGLVLAWAGSTPAAALVAVLAAAVPLVSLREFGRRFAFAQIELGRALGIDAAVAAMQLTLFGWLAFSGRLSAVAGLAALAGSCATVGLAWFIVCRRQFTLAPRALANDWRQNWSLGRWFLAGHVTGIIQAYALHWLLAILLGTAATGEFAAVVTIVSLANPLIIGIGNLLMPVTAHTFAQAGAAGVWRLAVRSTRWLALILAVFCLLAAFAGDWALALLYGDQFGGHTATVALLALAVSVAALGVSAEHGLRSLDRPRLIFAANLLALLITVALAAWLVPVHATTGAAASLLVGNLVGCAARWWAFRLSILDFVPARRDAIQGGRQ
jgi:O-antigen/teichoic acid export membrane protein